MHIVSDLLFSILGFLAGVGITALFYEVRGTVLFVGNKASQGQRGQEDN